MHRANGRLEAVFPLVVVSMLLAAAVAPHVVAAPVAEETESFDLDVDRKYATPPVADEATARVGDRTFDSAQAAVDAAEPGETVVLDGRFDERVTVNESNVTLTTEQGAVLDGGGEGRVLTIAGGNVTVEGLWISNSGYDSGAEDAGVFLEASADRTTLRELYLSEITFGVWIDGADEVTVADNRIEGREDVERRTDRGNGIQLWETEDTVIRGNEITDVRDGIYYSWASSVVSEDNTMWDNRYGVHFMYSDDNRLANNTAVDNDVGYALMVSDGLIVENNTAARNAGTSGHGILLKDIERSTLRGNVLIENDHGIYVYNTQDSRLEGNLLLHNAVGIHSTADSRGQTVAGNSFVHNDDAVVTTTQRVQTWNGTDGGNYWSDARTADLDGDGVSEVRQRPAGLVEHVVAEHPQAAVFADSPAFDAVRLAESSFPVVEAPGIVDRQPLVEPPHDWRNYADTS